MRLVISGIVMVLLLPLTTFGGELKGEDYAGEIIFQDGTTEVYTFLWSWLAGDKIPYSKDIMNIKGDTLHLRKIRLSSVSKIDFIDFTQSEKEPIKSANLKYSCRKAKITFRDGTVYEDIYLDCTGWWWERENEKEEIKGEIGREYSPSTTVKSLIIYLKKGIKRCPKCGIEFKKDNYKFCPFDGTLLKKVER